MFKQHKLKNGIRVIFSPNTATKAVTLMVMAKVGSRQEKAKNNGISHFLEHLMFKGTVRRPNTLVISQELDSVGADYNAWTAKDHTGYYVKAASANLPLAVDMLSDMLTNSIFAPAEVDRERGTILEEINMYEDNPMAKIGDLFEENLYGSETALGRHIIGTPENIRAITQKMIVAYWQEHYIAANLVISVAGNFKEKEARDRLEKSFGRIKRGQANKPARGSFKKSALRLAAYKKKTNQAHLVLGVPGVEYTHQDKYGLGLLAVILGGNMSSRLFISVRERLGLCYFIRAGSDSYEDTGSFAIQAGLDLKKLDKAIAAIAREIKDIKDNGVAEEELARAKQYLKGKLALNLEDSSDVASFYARQVMFQKNVRAPEAVVSEINKQSAADIKGIAGRIFDKKKLKLVAISPFRDITKFSKYIEI